MPKKLTPIQKHLLKEKEKELLEKEKDEKISRRKELEEQIQQHEKSIKEIFSLTAEDYETIRRNESLVPSLKKKLEPISSLFLEKNTPILEKEEELKKLNAAMKICEKLLGRIKINLKERHDEILEEWNYFTADSYWVKDPRSTDIYYEKSKTPEIPKNWTKSYFTEMWNLFVSHRNGDWNEKLSLEKEIQTLKEEIQPLKDEKEKLEREIYEMENFAGQIRLEKEESYWNTINTDAEHTRLVWELRNVEKNVTQKYDLLIEDLLAHPKKHLKPATGFFMDD